MSDRLREGFALGTANGVDLACRTTRSRHRFGDSFVARHDAPSIFAGRHEPSFTLDLCLEDLGLIDELSAAVDTSLPMTSGAHAVFGDASDRYGRDVGELHVARRLHDTGLSFHLAVDWTAPWEVDGADG